ncbi:formylglycine-generating enzyme family protein [bacterium]|nr:formylglycine-generating enzyme family protein [bacterium]
MSVTCFVNLFLAIGVIVHILKLVAVCVAVCSICGCDQGQAKSPTKLPESANSIGMKFKLVPAGTFMMGEGDEAHQVILSKPFKMGVHEVTQAQFEKVMGVNPSGFRGADNPVEKVSWNDAVEFCRKLSELPSEKAAGHVYRLPTEAEWEYACCAGAAMRYRFGGSPSGISDYAWYEKNSGETTHPVGRKKPNAWGFYDMCGNVWEWCQDFHGPYPTGSVTDPRGPASGRFRVSRGNGWYSPEKIFVGAGDRSNCDPTLRDDGSGFRVVLNPSGK